MLIHTLPLLARLPKRIRRLEHSSHQRLYESSYRCGGVFEAFADGLADFAEGVLDFVAGAVAEGAGGGEDGAWGGELVGCGKREGKGIGRIPFFFSASAAGAAASLTSSPSPSGCLMLSSSFCSSDMLAALFLCVFLDVLLMSCLSCSRLCLM